MRGATCVAHRQALHTRVSIHAPRAGRDYSPAAGPIPCTSFNPRAPCGARLLTRHQRHFMRQFQSTRPVRGATLARKIGTAFLVCFNPRAPCGARPINHQHHEVTKMFQSTRPVRGATREGRLMGMAAVVSIHAPRAGRDYRRAGGMAGDRSFNPRAPCGARLGRAQRTLKRESFQSTRPVRGATSSQTRNRYQTHGFNPRAPCGARQKSGSSKPSKQPFQSTRPVRGATLATLS